MSRASLRRRVGWLVLASVTLAALAAALVAVPASASDEYTDIPSGTHAPGLRALAGLGTFAGTDCSPGRICPDAPLQRWTMAVWLVRIIDGADPAAARASEFADVDAEAWWASHVDRLAELGVTKGCATHPARFCPQQPVTRAQMATFLARAFGLAGGPWTGFVDIDNDSHTAGISALAATGVTAGCSAEPLRYCPQDHVTRAQMATFLARALGLVPLPPPLATSLWVSLDSPAPDTLGGGTFDVTITFTEAVTGFAASDLSVSNGEVASLSGSGSAYTAAIEPSADGTVVVRVPADAVRDDQGRGNQQSEPLTRVRVSGSRTADTGIDTWDRAEVHNAFLKEFNRTEPDWADTGDVDNCVAGTTSQQFRDSVFQRLNWYRQMAGLGTVEEDTHSSAGAQQAALIMLANDELSHSPPRHWSCYSSTGRDYAASNLGLGTAGIAGIDRYMRDTGDQNTAVGHRRWILYPQTLEMGTGNVRRGGREANALWPRDGNIFSSRPAVRERRGFVAWPPSGFVPPQTVWGRWSFSLAGADLSTASVAMSDDDGPVRAEVIHRPRAAAPENAVVWAVAGVTSSDPLPVPSGPDHCYTVTVTGVRLHGATQAPYEYSTCLLGESSVPKPPDFQQTDTGGQEEITEEPLEPAEVDQTPGLDDQREPGSDDPPTTGDSFRSVTASVSHSCGLRADNSIACWGSNHFGQSSPPEGSFKAVTANAAWATLGHSCGLRADNSIACWGSNRFGQSSPPEGSFKAVTAGGAHSCGLRSDNSIACWGDNDYGQSSAPEGNFKAVTASGGAVVGSHSCGLRSDNSVACWGSNRFGQLDAPEGSFKALTAGSVHSCGLRSDNSVACWGNNEYGQLDAPEGSFKALTAGGVLSCGLRSDNSIACWGDHRYGQLRAPEGSFKAVAAGATHGCGVRSDNSIACWGSNHFGQAWAPGMSFKAVTAGKEHGCGLRSDNSVACWGQNTYGQSFVAPEGSFKALTAGFDHGCGLRSDNSIACWGHTVAGQSFVAPEGGFKAVAAGASHSCGLRSDNSVACWGDHRYGQLDAPEGSFKAVAAGFFHSCGLRSDNSVACWGLNEYGQLDAPEGSFKAVAAGASHSCGLRSDNSVACWGDHEYGQLDAPEGSFKAVAAGNTHSCGLRSDNSLACWGSTRYGTSAPTQPLSERYAPEGSFKAITGRAQTYCGLRSDNSIACWGLTVMV